MSAAVSRFQSLFCG